jgi:hypothetical protein
MLALLAIAALGAAPASKVATIGCELPKKGRVELSVPASWRVMGCATYPKPPSFSLALKLGPSSDARLVVNANWVDPKTPVQERELRRVASVMGPPPKPPEKAAMEAVANGERPADPPRTALPQSFLKGDQTHGYFVRPLIRGEQPGQKGKQTFGGAFVVSEAQVVVSFDAEEEPPETVDALIAALKTLRYVPKK